MNKQDDADNDAAIAAGKLRIESETGLKARFEIVHSTLIRHPQESGHPYGLDIPGWDVEWWDDTSGSLRKTNIPPKSDPVATIPQAVDRAITWLKANGLPGDSSR